MSQELDISIYGLVDPRTGHVRYVGQTRNVHLRYRHHQRNQKVARLSTWMDELRNEGFDPTVMILEETKPPEARARERYWIETLTKQGIELLNTHWCRTGEKVRRVWEWDQDIYTELEILAEREHRTVASQVLYIVQEFLKRDEANKPKE